MATFRRARWPSGRAWVARAQIRTSAAASLPAIMAANCTMTPLSYVLIRRLSPTASSGGPPGFASQRQIVPYGATRLYRWRIILARLRLSVSISSGVERLFIRSDGAATLNVGESNLGCRISAVFTRYCSLPPIKHAGWTLFTYWESDSENREQGVTFGLRWKSDHCKTIST